ncbi:hypothetical protein PENTCL1PPCAC_29255 [Pristionchus entomophagus]|uniref:Uncharacterized protein n=1 Tax=Pristionchus entomophagus TaxID=358040 RepID=A0AAV5UJ85_9BILA|nr:hypothetical protein PENTCL1PPCAC_29255 [Pristionchus entomophagus]
MRSVTATLTEEEARFIAEVSIIVEKMNSLTDDYVDENTALKTAFQLYAAIQSQFFKLSVETQTSLYEKFPVALSPVSVGSQCQSHLLCIHTSSESFSIC